VNQPIIVLVEDNADDELLTVRALAKVKFANDVIVVRDGVEALEYFFGKGDEPPRAANQPHLILLDLKLPRVDGLEVLKALRTDERTVSHPVVVLTSSSEPSDLKEAYRLGANSYIQKPVDFASFMEVAVQLGMYWLVLNEFAPPVGQQKVSLVPAARS
jgi:two-component system, response regulator